MVSSKYEKMLREKLIAADRTIYTTVSFIHIYVFLLLYLIVYEIATFGRLIVRARLYIMLCVISFEREVETVNRNRI